MSGRITFKHHFLALQISVPSRKTVRMFRVLWIVSFFALVLCGVDRSQFDAGIVIFAVHVHVFNVIYIVQLLLVSRCVVRQGEVRRSGKAVG